jgi:tryptophan synthase beta chain
VLHGARSYLMQDDDGQTQDTTSISAGLDYPGVGPEHAWLRDSGRAHYRGVTDADAMAALEVVAKKEGILCAIESAHAFAGAFQWLQEQGDVTERAIVINCSGRGDKDVDTAARWFGLVTAEEVAESELVRAREGEQP